MTVAKDAGETIASAPNPIPPHVPADKVMFFDFNTDEQYGKCPHARLGGLQEEHRVFYTPTTRSPLMKGGTWVFTHAEDMRAVMTDPVTFRSSGNRPMGQAIGEDWVLIPIDLDPPEHGKFRAIMNPIFSPNRMNALGEKVEDRAIAYIEKLRGRNGCAFFEDFARPFPVSIFLEMFGFPLDEIDRFVVWVELIIHSKDAVRGIRELRDYLAEVIAARTENPTDDLISFAVQAKIDGRALTYDEVMGMCVMLFIAGLDTVTSTLGFIFHHLATHPDQQAQLRADPALIPDAVEEMLRAYAIITTGRIVGTDVDIAGVTMKAGDIVACPMAAASRDPEEFENPADVDFARSPNRHSAFGYGPHRCIGSHLARRELNVAVREWLSRLPPFRLKEGVVLHAAGAGVVSYDQLPLVWD